MALTDKLTAIGNAIREKNGTTEKIPLADMPQAIKDIVCGGGGVQYTNIVYNEDDTFELTDTDGIVHTMECTYTDGKLTSVKYDGKPINLTYNGDELASVGGTEVDMSNAPINSVALDHTVTFMVDEEPYEVVSVKNGNQVSEPTVPIKKGCAFTVWQTGDETIDFPFTPTSDIEAVANFEPATVQHQLEFTERNNTFFTVFPYKFGKLNDGISIAGYWCDSSGKHCMVSVAKTDEASHCYYINTQTTSSTRYTTPETLTFADETYYYIVDGCYKSNALSSVDERIIYLNDYIDDVNATNKVVALTLIKIYLGYIPIKAHQEGGDVNE